MFSSAVGIKTSLHPALWHPDTSSAVPLSQPRSLASTRKSPESEGPMESETSSKMSGASPPSNVSFQSKEEKIDSTAGGFKVRNIMPMNSTMKLVPNSLEMQCPYAACAGANYQEWKKEASSKEGQNRNGCNPKQDLTHMRPERNCWGKPRPFGCFWEVREVVWQD